MSCLHNVGFFYLRHAVPEVCCLTEVVFKTLTPVPGFISFHLFSMLNIAAHLLRSRHRASASYGVGGIGSLPFVDLLALTPASLIVIKLPNRAVILLI